MEQSIYFIYKKYTENLISNYKSDEKEFENIDSINDIGKFLNGKKILFSHINFLCKMCLNTRYSNICKDNPTLYFLENRNKIHYLEFIIGTETIYHGQYLFNFDIDFYKRKFVNKYKTVSMSEYKNSDDEYMLNYVNTKKHEYMYNLIHDKSTNCNKKFLL